MPDHKIGTREDWQAARDELAKLEAEHAELGQKVTEQRRQLPWVSRWKDGMSRDLLSSSADDPRRCLTVELEEAPSDDRNGT